MDENGFTYPVGMDVPIADYIRQKWCFVAVRTRIGAQAGVHPVPGMREADAQPPVAGFEGHVQAMGFRFLAPEPVVPMRLSAFNEGALRNRVVILVPTPMSVEGLPATMVRHQLDGSTLRKNLSQPLPLFLLAGTAADLTLGTLLKVARLWDPGRVNGLALELFSADLAAAERGVLSLAEDAAEKELLEIGERLGLRGQALDRLHRGALETGPREEMGDLLETMWLTVVEGAFPRELIAAEDLRLIPFVLSGDKPAGNAGIASATYGTVLQNTPPVCSVELGWRDGLQAGHTLTIARGQDFVGQLVVEQVESDICHCRVLFTKSGSKLQVGDRVVPDPGPREGVRVEPDELKALIANVNEALATE